MPERQRSRLLCSPGSHASAWRQHPLAQVVRWACWAVVVLAAPALEAADAAGSRANPPTGDKGAKSSEPIKPISEPPALRVPVHGVAPPDLRDTYTDQRGGGASVHEALDIMAPRSTPVLAADAGRIAKLFLSQTGGITIYQFDPSGRFAYYYAHLDGYAKGLVEGQAVRRGQVLGYVGSTGNARADAPHLHFGIFRLDAEQRWWSGVPINPLPYLRGADKPPPAP